MPSFEFKATEQRCLIAAAFLFSVFSSVASANGPGQGPCAIRSINEVVAREKLGDLLLVSSQLSSLDPVADPKPEDAIVEVKGGLVGSGTLVLIGDEVKIVTNQHVIQNLESVEISLPGVRLKSGALYKKAFRAKREFPGSSAPVAAVSDIAVLSVQEDDPELIAVLRELARQTVRFRRSGSDGRRYETPKANAKGGSRIYSVVGAKKRVTEGIDPWDTRSVPDQYISGLYEKVYVAPIYSRPGMSGGALFSDRRYAGMVTKVDLGGSLNTYVIPVEEMAKVISAAYFGEKPASLNSSEAQVIKSAWRKTAEGEVLLEAQLSNGALLRSSSRSGRTGVAGGEGGYGGGGEGGYGGGGEGGYGGGEGAAHGRYWKLEVQTQGDHRSEVEIANPFEAGNRAFEINGDPVAYFEKEERGKGKVFQAATMARYLSGLRQEAGGIRGVKASPGAESGLFEARIRDFSASSSTPGFARSYEKESGNRLRLVSGGYGVLERDGAQALFPWKDQMNALAKAGMGPKHDSLVSSEPDSEGFYAGSPLSARKSDQNFIDVRFRDQKADFSVQAPKDLSRIEIRDASVRDRPLVLERVSRKDAPALVYETPDGRYRAAVVFDEANMSKMERAFVETPNRVLEFVNCEPGRECWR